MRKVFITILLLQFFMLDSEAQWIIQPTGNVHPIRDVEFINSYTGWACGDNYIYKTTNGGNNWIEQSHPDAYLIQQIFPVNNRVVYSCGWWNLMKTTNGGENWYSLFDSVPSSQLPVLEALYFLNENTGWLAGNVVVMKTTNGGVSFDTAFCPNGDVDDFYFRNAMEGLGCKGMVKTTDGGNSWFSVYLPILNKVPEILRMSFINYYTGFCVSVTGITLRTTNFGLTWDSLSQIPNLGTDFIRCTEFTDISTGYAAGEGSRMYKTTDGGYNWKRENTGLIGYNFHSISFVSDSIGWACKGGGIILKTTTGGQTSVEMISQKIPQEYLLHQNYPNPFNGQTTFEFEIIKENRYKFIIYDLLGREMKNLFEKNLGLGVYRVNFDSENLSTGTFFYRLLSDEISLTKSFQLIK